MNHEFKKSIKEGDITLLRKIFAKLDKALDSGIVSEIELARKQCPDVNMLYGESSAILYLADKGRWDMVVELYNLGADINVKREMPDWGLAHEVVLNAPMSVIKGMLDGGLDINIKDYLGRTPIMLVMERGKDEVVDLLMSFGVSTNDVDNDLNSVAHYAAKYGYSNHLIELFERGTVIFSQNKDKDYPVDLIADPALRMSLSVEIERLEEEGVALNYSKEDKGSKYNLGLSKIEKRKVNYGL